MAFINLVQQRQSTRAYRATPVPRALIERCLEAARLAPSACNCQPWRFIVVDDLDTRSALATAAFSGVYSMCAFAKHAPVLIAVITERSSYAAALGGMFRGTQYNLIDIGIACEHLVLQATEEGLGTCWLGWFNEMAVRKVLGLPASTKIDVLISMGYPDHLDVRPKTRKSLDDIRRYTRQRE